MKKIQLGATEVIFLLGLVCLGTGFTISFGFGFGLISVGSILLVAAFRNATEREKGQ